MGAKTERACLRKKLVSSISNRLAAFLYAPVEHIPLTDNPIFHIFWALLLELDLERPLTEIDKIRKIVNRDGPYYHVVPGSDNPYRDGYVTEPPKKPRASYLFFQSVYRSEYNRRYPDSSQSEIMTMLGDTWRAMSEAEQAPYIQLAQEEVARYEKEKALLEKAQRPNELWQPLRRCRLVLDRLSADSFAQIFLEPVNVNDFPDYTEYVDQPMDLGTIRSKLEKKKYQAPENFARDVRRVSA